MSEAGKKGKVTSTGRATGGQTTGKRGVELTSHVRLKAVRGDAATASPGREPYLRAVQAMRGRRWHEGLRQLRQALELDREEALHYGAFAWCLLNIYPETSTSIESLDKMLRIIDRAIALDALNDSFHHSKGLILERMGRPRGALAEFEHAVSLNPRNIDAARKIHLARRRSAAQRGKGVFKGLFKRR